MRVTGDTPKKSRDQIAVQVVNEEYGVQTSFQNSTKPLKPNNFITPNHEQFHDFTNCLTGEKEQITDSQLIKLARLT
jgi:hypothetical protein